MPRQSRPLLAVRLIGPTETVTRQKAYLSAYLAESLGAGVMCRTSTHPAGHAGEARVYLTLTAKEASA
jgi:hypothetical protein